MGGGQLSSLREKLRRKKEEAALALYSPELGVKQGLGEGFGDSLQRRDVLRRGIHQNMNGLRNNAGINRSIHVFVYLFPKTYLKLFGE